MSDVMTITAPVDFSREARGRLRLATQPQPATATARPQGRVPRVARLMALAMRLEAQVRRGELTNYSELARVGHVTRARISQILNLINLAPDIQEAILCLPLTEHGRDPIHLAMLQPIAAAFDWQKQRRLWQPLLRYSARP
jgi:hypothetical protein